MLSTFTDRCRTCFQNDRILAGPLAARRAQRLARARALRSSPRAPRAMCARARRRAPHALATRGSAPRAPVRASAIKAVNASPTRCARQLARMRAAPDRVRAGECMTAYQCEHRYAFNCRMACHHNFPQGDHAFGLLKQSRLLRWHGTSPLAARPEKCARPPAAPSPRMTRAKATLQAPRMGATCGQMRNMRANACTLVCPRSPAVCSLWVQRPLDWTPSGVGGLPLCVWLASLLLELCDAAGCACEYEGRGLVEDVDRCMKNLALDMRAPQNFRNRNHCVKRMAKQRAAYG